MKNLHSIFQVAALGLIVSQSAVRAQDTNTPDLKIDWSKNNRRIQVHSHSPGSGKPANPSRFNHARWHLAALKMLGVDYVRYVPWLPYPKQAVAELEPPTKDKTFWNFEFIDPALEDFMKATEGHSVVMNFSTIPA